MIGHENRRKRPSSSNTRPFNIVSSLHKLHTGSSIGFKTRRRKISRGKLIQRSLNDGYRRMEIFIRERKYRIRKKFIDSCSDCFKVNSKTILGLKILNGMDLATKRGRKKSRSTIRPTIPSSMTAEDLSQRGIVRRGNDTMKI